MKTMKPKMMSGYMKGGTVPNGKMMMKGGAMTPGPVGTGGMKNPNKMATCNSVNQ
jgi:hypothetical protein